MLGGEAPRSSSLGGGLGCRTVGLAVSGWPREGGQAGSTWPFRFPTGSSLLLSPSPQLHPLPRSSGWQPRPESPQVGTAPPAADEEAWLRGRAEQSPLRPPEPSSTWSAALWGLGGGALTCIFGHLSAPVFGVCGSRLVENVVVLQGRTRLAVCLSVHGSRPRQTSGQSTPARPWQGSGRKQGLLRVASGSRRRAAVLLGSD